MTCKEFRPQLLEAARSGAAPPAHVSGCAACAQYYAEQRALTNAIAALVPLADAPPAWLETRLLAEVDSAARKPRFALRWAFAAAASIGAALLLLPRAPVPPATKQQPFVAIPFTAPLAPYEITRIERMDVPLAALLTAGFDVHASDYGASVRADVLFGQDGSARAIRIVSQSERRITQ